MADFNKTVDLDKGLNKILDRIDNKAEELRRRGEDAGESFGDGWDEGIDTTVEKIKASSIKMEKAFSNLSEKIRKQVQQLSTKVNGKDFKLKIDFSDININSDDIKNKVARIVKDISTEGLIEFDTKGSEQQFKNLITLYVKYQEKLNNLQGAAPNLTSSKDIELNLRQQLMLALKLKEIYSFLDSPGSIKGYSMEIKKMADQLVTVQKVVKQTQGGDTKVASDYNELSKVLKEIQGSLKVISDTFKNENNSMKAMAENGKTSFESLSQAIIGVYNNLTQVQSLVDTISKKDFNITNITQTGGASSNLQALTQQMAVARETMEHLRQLYDQAGDTLQGLGSKGQVDLVLEYSKQLQEFNLTDIAKSVKKADTEMKLASVTAEMQDHIDKLIQINELRNKYGLGEWKDTFVPTQKPVVKPTVQPEVQTVTTPTIVQAQVDVGSAETSQMTNLKGAVDEVSKAIGRKNAGFIKEKEIVDASVNAEEAKLRELVGVITNEIGIALDDIKAKFAQSFVVLELDKGNLQTSFDEIYNKFIELKDKIQTMEIDIGFNTANITTAIQEALYAKEIAANYRKADFNDYFEPDFDNYGAFINKLTGETFANIEEALKAFRGIGVDEYVTKNGTYVGTKDQMLADIISKLDIQKTNIGLENNNWTNVIVEAINTQGGRIVEAIKILLNNNGSVSDEQLNQALKTLSDVTTEYLARTGGTTKQFLQGVLSPGSDKEVDSLRSVGVDVALSRLGLLSDAGIPTFTLSDKGSVNLGTAISDKMVVSVQPEFQSNIDDLSELISKQNEAYRLGAAVPRILGGYQTSGSIYQVQERVPGFNHRDADSEFLSASDEQIDKLLYTFEKLAQVGLYPDFGGDNVLYDKKKGFSVIDLGVDDTFGTMKNNPKEMMDLFLYQLTHAKSTEEYGHAMTQSFNNRVRERFALAPEDRLVNDNTIAAERMAVKQDEAKIESNKVKITPIMDEGVVAKVVADNVAKTPATVKVTPVVDSASSSEQAIDGESQSAIDAAKTFVDAANAKKQFVEANKKVAESAKTSEGTIKKEAEAAKTVATNVSNTVSKVAKDLAKTKDVFNDAGELIQTDTTRKFTTDKAVVTETDSTRIMRDDDGNETTSTITTIVNDFEKLTKETKKSEEAVARAQKKLDEFLARFQSKSGGNAKFITGFSDLEGTKVTSDNMEDVFNKMTTLQEEYSKLETNFRKGQSSLNPFVNAITKSENIGNIFGDVERQFNGLTNKSDELVDNFTKLQELSKKIQSFTQLMNSDPNSITPGAFSEFSKQVGEFNVLKSQVEGSIKAESRTEADNAKKQAEAYAEILRLVKERNKFLATAESAEDGSIKQRNALMDAYKVEQQLSILGKQIVLTDEQRAELARVREEQARKIRDIEADNKRKADNQKASAREQKRKKEVEDYIKLIQQKNEYEAKAANGGAMKPTYEAKVAKLKQEIAANDKQSIMNQEEKNRLLAIEEVHQLKIAEIQQKKQTGNQLFGGKNDKLQAKFDAGYLSEDKFNYWKSELATYQSYLDGTVKTDQATIQKKEASLTQLYDHLNKISNASRTFFASGGEILSTWFNQDQIQNASTSLRALYDTIVADRFDGMKTSVTGVNETLGRLTFTVDDGKGSLSQYTIAMDKASGATKLLSGNTKETLSTVQQFGKALKSDVRGMFSAFIGGMSGMYAIGRYFKEGIQYVRELDKALTELKKVTDETEETYDRFLETAGKTSTRIGSTLSNMTSATAEFAKLGYDISTASSMAESALVYTNVGDNVDVETGSQSIISTLKAFGIEANNTMSIVDKFNEVGELIALR